MKTIPITDLHLNDGSKGLPKNPRFIRDERFKALVASVRDNPEFMPARPIIVDEAGTILGGNMRYRACKDLGMTELPAAWVQRVTGWSVEKKRRFIILDNRPFGEDDFDLLANEWDMAELLAAGFEEKELGDLMPDAAGNIASGEQIREQYVIMITCRDELQQTELLDRFLAEGLTCKALQS